MIENKREQKVIQQQEDKLEEIRKFIQKTAFYSDVSSSPLEEEHDEEDEERGEEKSEDVLDLLGDDVLVPSVSSAVFFYAIYGGGMWNVIFVGKGQSESGNIFASELQKRLNDIKGIKDYFELDGLMKGMGVETKGQRWSKGYVYFYPDDVYIPVSYLLGGSGREKHVVSVEKGKMDVGEYEGLIGEILRREKYIVSDRKLCEKFLKNRGIPPRVVEYLCSLSYEEWNEYVEALLKEG